jgi:hypothetical protein
MTDEFATDADFESLCFNAVAEGLRLEFKEKEDSSKAALSRSDKKQIAEAVTSFANSDGGTIIFGVKTERRGDTDVASALKPIADVEEFASNFRTVCSLNVSPPIPHIEVRAIRFGGSGRGFVVCKVDRSDQRPHMSTAPGVHSYFRRSFQGNVPMTPSELRDQILSVRDAVLDIKIRLGGGGMFTNHADHMSATLSVLFSLKNTGRTLCKNPFMRVNKTVKMNSNTNSYDSRFGGYKTEFPYGTMIHVEDELGCLNLQFSAIVDFFKLKEIFQSEEIDLTSSVILLPYHDAKEMMSIGDKESLPSLTFAVAFGAENAPARSEVMAVTRRAVAQKLLRQSSAREMFLASHLGPFDQGVVEEFAKLPTR